MDPLLTQLRELPMRFASLPGTIRMLLVGGLLLAVGLAAGASALFAAGDPYQYAFTNLTAEDSTEAAAALKGASIPFRLEAGGAAIAVPASKVYDARLLLASTGIPRGGGVGFELFDRGELGVSEFTQRINLRRAIEGELARTIGRLSEVRGARVHLTLSEKSLYRDEDQKASAAVVLTLQPGRTLGDRSLAGIRHLVASAVPQLSPDAVTVVDGHGAVLTSDSEWGDPAIGYQRRLERDMEQRLVSLLEPAVGAGLVVAKVSAQLDTREVATTAEEFDPENPALRSERKQLQSQTHDSSAPSGIAGAAANQPLVPLTPDVRSGARGNSSAQDETRNYELSKTVTRTQSKMPRLERLSVAVLLEQPEGKIVSEEQIARLTELARSAVGFDEARGDRFQLTTASVAAREAEPAAMPQTPPNPWLQPKVLVGGSIALILLVGMGLMFATRRRSPALAPLTLSPGMRVSELEQRAQGLAGGAPQSAGALAAGPSALAERARALASQEPTRAAHLIRAWISSDSQKEARNG